jgi:hypothetical protein
MRSLIIYLAGVNLEKSTKSHQTMEISAAKQAGITIAAKSGTPSAIR